MRSSFNPFDMFPQKAISLWMTEQTYIPWRRRSFLGKLARHSGTRKRSRLPFLSGHRREPCFEVFAANINLDLGLGWPLGKANLQHALVAVGARAPDPRNWAVNERVKLPPPPRR